MATSFINEHSVELSLVPYLKKELEKSYNFVAPLFPWLNRETSNISKNIHPNDTFKILIIFPRRPKITQDNSNNIFVTINEELLLFKDFANNNNVPVIAGCPIAVNFWELSQCNKYAWIEINKESTSIYLNQISGNHNNNLAKTISTASVVQMAEKSKLFNINSFQEFLENSKNIMPSVFLFGPKYKPTYFLIKDHK
jgi:hypothetical protein